MGENYFDTRDTGSDVRGVGGGRADYADVLAKGNGVDLNDWAANDSSGGMTENPSCDDTVGEDLNSFSKENNDKVLDTVLDGFSDPPWNDLSLEDQKRSMTDLADYVAADTGNEDPPEIVFSSDMPDGSYGGYNPNTNTIEINVNMLGDSAEAADTITHEMWHAHQHQCAMDPTSEKGREYQEGFDNYISPEYDFEAYEDQMVEAEAREYAQGFKNRMKGAA